MLKTKYISLMGLGLLVLATAAYFVLGRTGASGTVVASPDLPQPCDEQAAHPADVQRYAAGKADNEIVPVLAVRACTEAVSQFPRQARFQFQLGRSLLAMNRTDEADKAFEAASAMSYQAANFYLAEAKIDSYWQSESDSDYDDAKTLLEKAADSFPPARDRLGQLSFNPDAFSAPLVEALWDGDYQTLNKARLPVALYMRGLHDAMAMEFHPTDQCFPAYLADPSITFNLDAAVAGDPRGTIEGGEYYLALKAAEYAGTLVWDPVWKGSRDKWVEYYRGLGMRDGLFLAHHHGCDSPVTFILYRNLKQFSKTPRPLSEYAEGMLRGDAKDLFTKQTGQVAAGEK